MMENNFTIAEDIHYEFTGGSYWLRDLKVNTAIIAAIFGKENIPADLEQKYSGDIVLVHKNEPDTRYYLYTHYNVWRIGGWSTNKNIDELFTLITKYNEQN